MAAINVTSPDKLPKGEHWAIIGGTSVSIPGDLRSETNPGHGYPAHTDNFVTYEAYTDEGEFKSALERAYKSGIRTVRGIHVVATYTSRTTITLEAE